MESFQVRPVESTGGIFAPGRKSRVALLDGVFCYEVASSSQVWSVYFPKQNVRVSHKRRFDGRRLWIGLVAPLLVLMIGIPLMFVGFSISENQPNDEIMGLSIFAFMTALALAFLIAAVQLVRFFIRQRTTVVDSAFEQVSGTENDDDELEVSQSEYVFEFWHPAGKSRALDDFVNDLPARESAGDAPPSASLSFSHDWAYTRPLRKSALVTLAALFLVYAALKAAETVMRIVGEGDSLPTILASLFLLAPAAGIASFLHSRYRLARAEPGHSTALALFSRHDYDIARRDTDRILDAQPDDVEALMLAVHIRIRQGIWDEIAPLCQRLDRIEPDLGANLYLNVMKLWPGESKSRTDSAQSPPTDPTPQPR